MYRYSTHKILRFLFSFEHRIAVSHVTLGVVITCPIFFAFAVNQNHALVNFYLRLANVLLAIEGGYYDGNDILVILRMILINNYGNAYYHLYVLAIRNS